MAKTLMTCVGIVGLGVLASSGCKWSEFDDLESAAWVESTEKPDNDSSNWAVAIQRGQASGPGGRLVVIGASQSLYGELAFASDGAVSVPSTTLELNSQFGIGNLDPQPILLADPTSNDVALVTSSGSASIAVLRGSTGTLVAHQVFGPATVDAATYMIPPPPAMPIAQVLLAEGDTLYGAHFVNPPNPQPRCKLVDGGAPVLVRALAVRPGTQEIIVWSSTGKLMIFTSNLFNGALSVPACVTTGVGALAVSAMDTPVKPARGSQLFTFDVDGTAYAVLQGHDDAGNGLVALYNLNVGPSLIGTAHTENGVKTAAMFELAGKRYVLAGYPNANVDGTNGGKVVMFEVDITNGIGTAAVLTLHDAQPESNQQFGRSIAVMPFDGKPVIVVAADNEVFTYFRTNLYPDARSGR